MFWYYLVSVDLAVYRNNDNNNDHFGLRPIRTMYEEALEPPGNVLM